MTIPSTTAPRLPWTAADPYPFYERHRRDGDAIWDPTAQSWLVFGYRAAQQVLGGSGWSIDPLTNPNARQAVHKAGSELLKRSMLFTDGDEHRRLRASVRDVFTPSVIEGLTAGVQSIAAAVIGHPPPGAVFDFMTDICLPLPLAVIAEWIGLDVQSSKLVGVHSSGIIPNSGTIGVVAGRNNVHAVPSHTQTKLKARETSHSRNSNPSTSARA